MKIAAGVQVLKRINGQLTMSLKTANFPIKIQKNSTVSNFSFVYYTLSNNLVGLHKGQCTQHCLVAST